MMVAERIVDDKLERPGRGQTSGDLDQHGGKHDRQPAAIGPQQVDDEARHILSPY